MKAFWHVGAIAALVVASGCGGASSGHPASLVPATVQKTNPFVRDIVQNGTVPINWTQLDGPATGFSPSYALIASGTDMYAGNTDGGLMQIAMTGVEKLIPLTYVYDGTSTTNYVPGYGITIGNDKRLYMGGTNYDYNHSKYTVGATTSAGKLTVYDIPSGDYIGQGGLTKGPDKNVWFVEQAHIGKVTTTGTVTEYAYPSGATSNSYGSVTSGPDGDVWFSEYDNGIVGKVVPSTGKITEYVVSAVCGNPTSIIEGSDGNVHFACGDYMGTITPAGVVEPRAYDYFDISYLPNDFLIGPDGNIWFADANGSYIGEYNANNNSFTAYNTPYTSGTVYELAYGPDGNMWAEENDNKTDIYLLNVLGVSPTSLSFTATKQTGDLTVSEPGTTKWTASSVSTGVCSVAQGTSANVFVVTANGNGSTKITIKDAIGNSFVIPCKVT